MSEPFQIEAPVFDAAAGIARFSYGLGRLRFTETLAFPPGTHDQAAASEAFSRLLELTAVTLGVSYFKLLAPLHIDVDFPLGPEALDYALDVYSNGLGEFYARNGLSHFGRIDIAALPDPRTAGGRQRRRGPDDPAAPGLHLRRGGLEQFQQKWEPVLRPKLRLNKGIERLR